MSVLDNLNNVPSIPASDVVANKIKNQTRMTFNSMVKAFNDGAKLFWNNPKASSSEIAASLGSDAKEVFELHAKLGELIASVKPSTIQDGLSVVGEFTMNEDGTVTINS